MLGVFVEDAQQLKVVLLRQFIIAEIVPRRHFEGASAKLHIDIVIADDGNLALQNGHASAPPDEMAVTFVLWVHGDRGIAEDRLRARRGDWQMLAAFDRIAEIIERDLFFAGFHLKVGYSRLQARAPIDQARSAIDQALLPQRDEGLNYGFGQAVIEGEAFAIPIAAGAQPPQLPDDRAALLFLELPSAMKEFLITDFFSVRAFVVQHLFDLQLGGDAGVISSGQPKGGFAAHALVADHQVFQRGEKGVADMQAAGDVWRRHADDVGLGVSGGAFRLEPALRLPPVIDPWLGFGEVEILRHVLVGGSAHHAFLRCLDKKSLPSHTRTKGWLPRYHLASADASPLRSKRDDGREPARFYWRMPSFGQLPGDFRQALASGLSAYDPRSLLQTEMSTLPDRRFCYSVVNTARPPSNQSGRT